MLWITIWNCNTWRV